MINIVLTFIISLLIAYLLGSIPSAFLVCRAFKGEDIREVGSHNMGAMNVIYYVGFWPGMLVLGSDIFKGALAVCCALLVAIFLNVPPDLILVAEMLAGAAVILGHSFPVFLKFHGGKGGATAIGVLVFIVPWIVTLNLGEYLFYLPVSWLIYLGTFLLIMLITRWPTFSYGISFLCFPAMAWFVYHDAGLTFYSIGIALFPVLMYIPRLKEILNATDGDVKRAVFRKNLKDRM